MTTDSGNSPAVTASALSRMTSWSNGAAGSSTGREPVATMMLRAVSLSRPPPSRASVCGFSKRACARISSTFLPASRALMPPRSFRITVSRRAATAG